MTANCFRFFDKVLGVAVISTGEERLWKEDYVRRLFNAIAHRYDLMNLVMTWGLIRRWHKTFAGFTGLTEGGVALDVCCGTGDLARIMARQVGSSGEVLGVDFSPSMLAVGRRRLNRVAGGERVRLMHGDALDLPFEDNRFDCVATGFALRNVSDLTKALAEMVRVLKPGGRLVCLEISRPPDPVLRALFNFYLGRVIPLLGRWAARFSRPGEPTFYGWLPVSVSGFPDQKGLVALFEEAGLVNVTYRNLSWGAACLHVGQKPELSHGYCS